MNGQSQPSGPLIARIQQRLSQTDDANCDLREDIADLDREGWLTAPLPTRYGGKGWGSEPTGTVAAFDALRTLGRSNLSLARLFEGHMNACKLVALYANDLLQSEVAAHAHDGALLGVWGADDPQDPLRWTYEADSVSAPLRLHGAKRFASGLGSVSHAVLVVNGEAGPQLLIAPTSDASRADPSDWNMDGMRATRSGRYDFSGIGVPERNRIGDTGDYAQEPYFEGGIWRYCAAHLGAAETIYEVTRDELIARDRADDPHQQKRLVQMAVALETARLLLLRAALEVEARDGKGEKAVLSLLAREAVHDTCKRVIHLSEEALGMSAHAVGSTGERMRRDLALFLCQAAPDTKRATIARTLSTTFQLPEFL
ncbi:MAG: acyl-CoA dehydrogenase family protein [Erythrobacter sp.]|nr:acyl-CoA dehydrogenase family protein [Erythrobacter sp.]